MLPDQFGHHHRHPPLDRHWVDAPGSEDGTEPAIPGAWVGKDEEVEWLKVGGRVVNFKLTKRKPNVTKNSI